MAKRLEVLSEERPSFLQRAMLAGATIINSVSAEIAAVLLQSESVMGCKKLRTWQRSDSILSEITVGSPQNLSIFIIYKKNSWIKVSKKISYLILKITALLQRESATGCKRLMTWQRSTSKRRSRS